MWDNFHCEKCGLTNWLNLGDMEDITAPDVEAFRCIGCKNVNLIIEEAELEAMYGELEPGETWTDKVYIEDGEVPPGSPTKLPTVREMFNLKAVQTGRLHSMKEITLSLKLSQRLELPNPEIDPAAYDEAQRRIISGLENQGWSVEVLGEEV